MMGNIVRELRKVAARKSELDRDKRLLERAAFEIERLRATKKPNYDRSIGPACCFKAQPPLALAKEGK